ncbi:hypothetical protein [Azospirillum sp. sgz302134]
MNSRKITLTIAPEAALGGDRFLVALCRTIPAIAGHDTVITLREYALAVAAADRLADLSGRRIAVMHIVLEGLREPPGLKAALKDLSKAAADRADDVRQAGLAVLYPLLTAQGARAQDLLDRVADALTVPKAMRPDLRVLKEGGGLIQGLKFLWNDPYADVSDFAESFGLTDISAAVTRCKSGQLATENLRGMVESAVTLIRGELQDFAANLEHLDRQKHLASKLRFTAQALIEQVEQRLDGLVRRAALQKEMFREELKAFLEDAVNDIEIEMRDRMKSDDWLDEQVWTSFAKSQHGRAVQVRYEQLKRRYERQIEAFRNELAIFRKQLEVSSVAFMTSFDHRDFAGLVRPPSWTLQALGAADKAASATLVVGGVAGVGSAIAIASGVLSVSTVGALALTPVAPLVLAPLAVAGLYKWMADPERRKQKALKSKRAEIEAGLAALLGDPSKAHDEALDRLLDEFYRVAADLLSPITYEGQAAEAMLTLQKKLSTQLCRTTEERLIAVCRALPAHADG